MLIDESKLGIDGRIDKDSYYLNIAKEVAKRGTCLRRNYGAVIVKNDEIVSTGYTGAPRGRINCNKIGRCIRMEKQIPSGQRYELCRSVHAEMNAIISAPRERMIGATLYLYGWDVEHNIPKAKPVPCTLCERMIINAGIEKVITYNPEYTGDYYAPKTLCYLVKDYITEDPALKELGLEMKKPDHIFDHFPQPDHDRIDPDATKHLLDDINEVMNDHGLVRED